MCASQRRTNSAHCSSLPVIPSAVEGSAPSVIPSEVEGSAPPPGPNDGTRILNGDRAEEAGSAPLGVEMGDTAYVSYPSTTSKSLTVRRRDRSATPGRSGRFREDRRSDPRSVVGQAEVQIPRLRAARCARDDRNGLGEAPPSRGRRLTSSRTNQPTHCPSLTPSRSSPE